VPAANYPSQGNWLQFLMGHMFCSPKPFPPNNYLLKNINSTLINPLQGNMGIFLFSGAARLGLGAVLQTSTFMLFSFFILLIYAFSARSARVWFTKGKRFSWLHRISGTIFISFEVGHASLKK